MKASLKKLLSKILKALPDLTIYHTCKVTYDSFSSDGYAGYINASTIGVADLTKYIWIVAGDDYSWETFSKINNVESNRLVVRTWYMSSPSAGNVVLLKNAKPQAFRLIGIRKWGG